MHPNSPWDHTPTPPTRSQWNNPHNVVHWNNTSAVPNQGLEMQQNRLENSRLQNEIERLRQQLKQQQHQTPNDVWLIEQNHELHARVARLTQEVQMYIVTMSCILLPKICHYYCILQL